MQSSSNHLLMGRYKVERVEDQHTKSWKVSQGTHHKEYKRKLSLKLMRIMGENLGEIELCHLFLKLTTTIQKPYVCIRAKMEAATGPEWWWAMALGAILALFTRLAFVLFYSGKPLSLSLSTPNRQPVRTLIVLGSDKLRWKSNLRSAESAFPFPLLAFRRYLLDIWKAFSTSPHDVKVHCKLSLSTILGHKSANHCFAAGRNGLPQFGQLLHLSSKFRHHLEFIGALKLVYIIEAFLEKHDRTVPKCMRIYWAMQKYQFGAGNVWAYDVNGDDLPNTLMEGNDKQHISKIRVTLLGVLDPIYCFKFVI
eukprot:Gb_10153 [translate_table: standard]